jgi:hypothetical protein
MISTIQSRNEILVGKSDATKSFFSHTVNFIVDLRKVLVVKNLFLAIIVKVVFASLNDLLGSTFSVHSSLVGFHISFH